MSAASTTGNFSDERSLASLAARVREAKSSLANPDGGSEEYIVGDTSTVEVSVIEPPVLGEAPTSPAVGSPGKPPRAPSSPAAKKLETTTKAASKGESNYAGSYAPAYSPTAPKRDTRGVTASYFVDPENPPPTDMAIVGIPDDVSTIANDTITGSIGRSIAARFFKNKAVTPDRQRGTPKDDGVESPPGFNGTIQIPSPSKDGDLPPPPSGSWGKKKYCYASLLGIFLLCAIAALSYGLLRVRDIDSNSSTSTNLSRDWDWTFRPTGPSQVEPTMAPSMSWSPTVPGETRSPTRFPTAAPTTSAPTQSSAAPTLTRAEVLKAVLGDISSSIVEDIETDGTTQQQAFEWLANDPEYFSYSDRKVVQRWVLAHFSLEIATTRRRLSNRRLNEAMETWMEYTDECTWFTSWYENRVACDSEGTFKFLVLRNIGLDGRIPTELSLLTKLGKFGFVSYFLTNGEALIALLSSCQILWYCQTMNLPVLSPRKWDNLLLSRISRSTQIDLEALFQTR